MSECMGVNMTAAKVIVDGYPSVVDATSAACRCCWRRVAAASRPPPSLIGRPGVPGVEPRLLRYWKPY